MTRSGWHVHVIGDLRYPAVLPSNDISPLVLRMHFRHRMTNVEKVYLLMYSAF